MTRVLNEEQVEHLVRNKKMDPREYMKSGDGEMRYMKRMCAITEENNRLLEKISRGDETVIDSLKDIMERQRKIIASMIQVMDRMSHKRVKSNFEFTINREFDGKIKSVIAKEI